VTVDLSALTAVRLLSHPDDLGRVIRNLLDNAEHHAENLVGVAITADSGKPNDHHRRRRRHPTRRPRPSLRRFYRLQAARDHDTGGAGLGLAIARAIVEALAGHIWVAPSTGGAELHVRLPLV
jgi:signal transduction histidine kinase